LVKSRVNRLSGKPQKKKKRVPKGFKRGANVRSTSGEDSGGWQPGFLGDRIGPPLQKLKLVREKGSIPKVLKKKSPLREMIAYAFAQKATRNSQEGENAAPTGSKPDGRNGGKKGKGVKLVTVSSGKEFSVRK